MESPAATSADTSEILDGLVDLKAQSRDELRSLVRDFGAQPYRADQIWRWLHRNKVRDFAAMKNLPKELRSHLAQRAQLGNLRLDTMQKSVDGTRKIRFLTEDGRAIESVLIPDGDKLTLCISSQAGCALGCDFCATAKLGLLRNLRASEIVDQVYQAEQVAKQDQRRITNIVYMGMGEPLHNYDEVLRSFRILVDSEGSDYSRRKVTVSTVGLVPGIERLGTEPVCPNLAVSLSATTDEVRNKILPVNKKYNIARLMAAIRAYPLDKRARITISYVMLAGLNDTVDDARRLKNLLRGIPAKVNVIPWNEHPGADFRSPSGQAVERFQRQLQSAGLAVYVRTPRGTDIDAACGQLANRDRDDSGLVKLG